MRKRLDKERLEHEGAKAAKNAKHEEREERARRIA